MHEEERTHKRRFKHHEKDHRFKHQDKDHVPRKMMKYIIERELKSQGQEIFNQLIKCKDLG